MPFIPDIFYKRENPNTIFVRDRQGRSLAFNIRNGNAYPAGAGITYLGPTYGRFDWQSRRRFTASVRANNVLESVFDRTPQRQIIRTDWFSLPRSRSTTRRARLQGMRDSMIDLTGAPRSAREYIIWLNDRRLSLAGWEWCHLQAHSMGGRDNPNNVVAARRGNNSEQLIIENALHLYRCEDYFDMRVTAALDNSDRGRHLGNVIRYEIRCRAYASTLTHYLDCLGAPNPSGIHHAAIHQAVCRWLNIRLGYLSQYLHHNSITAAEKRAVLDYLRTH